MGRVESITFNSFMNKDFTKTKIDKKVKITLYTGLTIGAVLMPISFVDASTGIDGSAKLVYGKLLSIGKWIIIIKGGIDTINSSIKGDFDTAKKSFFSYLIVYLVLNGLPWAFDEVDKVFKEL